MRPEPVRNPKREIGADDVGSDPAFEAVFRAHYDRLCGFAYRLVGCTAAAEDLVQEVFLDAWDRRGTWGEDGAAAAKGYLFRAVRNAALNYLRAARLREHRVGDAVALFDRPSAGADAAYAGTELAIAVRRAIQQLPDRTRQIFTMNREQGLTYSEIAGVLGISTKTVETLMGRALKSLRRALAPNWP